MELGNGEGDLCTAGNKAWIENENIRVDYKNDKEGMRQDFIIKNKPEGSRPFRKGEGKLRLNFSTETKLKVQKNKLNA